MSGAEQTPRRHDGTTDVAAAAEGARLLLAVREWIAQDPDPAARRELEDLLDAAQDPAADEQDARAAVAELAERFSGTLQFGTAGLRAPLGAGPMRMNRAVVRRAAAGVGAHVLELVRAAEGPEAVPRAVVGFDARHGSAQFAADTAAVLTAAGCDVRVLPRPLPTPVLAWSVRDQDADVGIMVTASHNPAADNGYKVYLGGRAVPAEARGCQIVPPHDARIARRIEEVGDLRELALAASGWRTLPEDVEARYLDAVLRPDPAPGPPSDLRIVLTAMHGVGGATALEALRRAGFDDVRPVPEQIEPDPDFPTAPFPNPEEPGALDLALDLARDVDADLVLALDPDADRCAAAVPDAHHPRSAGGWRVLTGDEVGALLGRRALRRLADDATAPARSAAQEPPVVACSIVSSRLLGRMARAAQTAHRETLTGFKWIARVPGLVFGYEEALGYYVAPGVVRDKDGITAAAALARTAAHAAARGRTLADELDELALAHGLHTTAQLAIRVGDLERIPAMMATLRERTPSELAGSTVTAVDDLSRPDPASGLRPTEGLRLLTEDDTRVIVRPSGTEPKLKCYLEVVTPVARAEDLPAARRAGQERVEALIRQLRALLVG